MYVDVNDIKYNVNFPFLCGYIHASPAYGIFIAH